MLSRICGISKENETINIVSFKEYFQELFPEACVHEKVMLALGIDLKMELTWILKSIVV